MDQIALLSSSERGDERYLKLLSAATKAAHEAHFKLVKAIERAGLKDLNGLERLSKDQLRLFYYHGGQTDDLAYKTHVAVAESLLPRNIRNRVDWENQPPGEDKISMIDAVAYFTQTYEAPEPDAETLFSTALRGIEFLNEERNERHETEQKRGFLQNYADYVVHYAFSRHGACATHLAYIADAYGQCEKSKIDNDNFARLANTVGHRHHEPRVLWADFRWLQTGDFTRRKFERLIGR